jgi:hypothetical protein
VFIGGDYARDKDEYERGEYDYEYGGGGYEYERGGGARNPYHTQCCCGD